MSARIIGIGTALPAHSISQTDSFEHARHLCCDSDRQGRVLEQLYKKTRIKQRSRVVGLADSSSRADAQLFMPRHNIADPGPTTDARMQRYRDEAGPLADAACRAALHHASTTADRITHLVTASCTGLAAPGFDLYLFDSLHLSPAVQRTHVGFMGCHGALNAIRVARSFCQSDPHAVVLLCATELCSLHFQYGWQPDSVVANSLFADGAAALVISQCESGIQMQSTRSFVVPDTEDAMSWTIGNNGFVMTLAGAVPEVIRKKLPEFITSWLADNGLAISDIGSWAVHPGGPRILDAVEESLGLTANDLLPSRQILSECGNMSSPTVIFILERLIALKRSLPCVMLGFGPGLTIEAMLIC